MYYYDINSIVAFEHKLTIDLKNQIFWSSVTKGNKDVLQFMIEQCGMDVEMGDANERTVIEIAAQNGNLDEVLQRSVFSNARI
jgi:hypothetical protein